VILNDLAKYSRQEASSGLSATAELLVGVVLLKNSQIEIHNVLWKGKCRNNRANGYQRWPDACKFFCLHVDRH